MLSPTAVYATWPPTPADPRRSAVGPFDDLPLDGVQVHVPAFEASLEDGLQCFVVGGDEGPGRAAAAA